MASASSIEPQQQLLALFQQGRLQELVELAGGLELTPETHPLACQVLAAALFKLGEYGRAADLLEPLEAVLGGDRDFLSLHGATCRRLGLLDRARDLLGRALELDPAAPDVRNNYANVLIDLGELAEARRLLEAVLAENPDYHDARVNLNRLQFREQTAAAPATAARSGGGSSSPADAGGRAAWQLSDPLMLAFAEEEVRQAGGVAPAAPPDPSGQPLVEALPQPRPDAMAAEQLRVAARAVSEGNPAFALQLCGQALLGLGANAGVYANAADAYIRLKRFQEAEVCLLHALALGGPTMPTYINLISLASLRGDLTLAQHYLEAAAGLDPTHPQLQPVRQQIAQRRQALTAPFRFEPAWGQASLQSTALA